MCISSNDNSNWSKWIKIVEYDSGTTNLVGSIIQVENPFDSLVFC